MAADFQRCAELIGQADGLLVTAGAGIGVDSGLPDFRGPQGFWGAYPALGRARIAFEQIANPAAFDATPRLAWGFYAHRLQLYRRTLPHQGFAILREIGERLAQGTFVFTSNVDGQFQKAGFPGDRISECHGSIHHLQCSDGCRGRIWPADDFDPEIDEEQCLLTSEPPRCPRCQKIARPNILMFGDWGWLSERSDAQQRRLQSWLDRVERLLVIEVGAGTSIPGVRRMGERRPGQLIRINAREPQLPAGKGVSVAAGGLEALREIAARLD
ncbi:Sir2 family NAD-dependent protein deacetylase [Accumulibacter sp.]|uniref:SIR2 family NAD-dependent protein deacylase n=1 Tax=Accumulibacter sp. TaxID=2053492 RepID=UPI0025E887D9|nr:Sir2 family NAD-dependent protein deacetylase [Accumulibacter sp.]MCP5230159.1 NAD-dependent deacetylase [Accumulibacter sp.]